MPALAESALKPALLTAAELPGWKKIANSTDDDLPKITPDLCQPLFDKIDKIFDPPAVLHSAESTFQRGGEDSGDTLTVDVGASDQSDLAAAVDTLREVTTRCPAVKADFGPDKATIAVSALPPIKAGDHSAGLRLVINLGGDAFTSDLVLVSVGPNLIGVSVDGAKPLPASELTEIVQASVTKVTTAAQR